MREAQNYTWLTAIAIVTTVTLCLTTEKIAHHAFPVWSSSPSCYDTRNEAEPRATPNCVYVKKVAEAPPVIYHLNGCAHRTNIDCTRKDPGTFRIAVIGSSIVLGAHLPEADTFVHLLSTEIPQTAGGKRVEFYNASLGGGSSPQWYVERFNEILAVKPDMILWPIVPHDVEVEQEPGPPPPAYPGPLGETRYALVEAWKARSMNQAMSVVSGLIRTNLNQTSSATMLEHFLYLSPTEYQKVVMADPAEHGFLKARFDADWRNHIRLFSGDAAAIEEKAQSAGIPLVAFMIPDRGTINMLSLGSWPDGWNPYELDNELRRIVTSHGGIYFDILPAFQTIPDAALDYFPVNDHPNEEGHKLLASLIARELANTSPLDLRGVGSLETISKVEK